ncbi:MAG: ATP-binding cassette domain-containing protein [Clostridia bacterium]|nr:ATP-binding cassette domain-containing protein [Clostridia bacterium]
MESYKINNLKFRYPTSDSFALKGVNLSVKKGEFIVICGPSGCGKSTLLRLLKPILSPNGEREGEILFEDKDVFSLDTRLQSEKIGFVMQSPENQIVTDKVWHELAFGLESLGLPNSEIRVRVSEMASFFGIEDWFYKKTTDLSGGQKQLLNLASVMVMQPSVLILDEPTSQLDPIASQELLDAVYKINRELGVTVILSEHRLEEALSFADKMLVLDEGRIAFCGAPADAPQTLKKQKSTMLEAMPAAMRVFASLEKEGASPVTVREGRGFLENFLKEHLPKKIEKEEKKIESSAVLKIEDVYFRYEKNSPDVIKSLSLEVKKGELYTILGGNGSGKTTTLSLISRINNPYRGKITVNADVVGFLPQNPQTLFTGKTVEEDIRSMLSKGEEKRFDEVVQLCELKHLLSHHPYDLSGGEMQRAALAKVLLRNPDILLLDEPTKGMDARFKKKLAKILESLKTSGATIIMVSHDIEFCAKYADRCAMFFDGGIVSEGEPFLFFSGKSFYTTAANRMSRGIIDNCVTTEDIIKACGGEETEEKYTPPSIKEKKEEPQKPQNKKSRISRYIMGTICFILGILLITKFRGIYNDWRIYAVDLGIILSFGIGANLVIPQKKLGSDISINTKKRKKGRGIFSGALTLLVLIPLTVLLGLYVFDDKKYYFISLLIVLEAMIPFAISFEKKNPSTREIVVISVLCAIGIAGRIAFAVLPQFKPLAAVVIITGICFGAESGFLTGAISAFVSNFYFGQGPWTPWQMFGFAALGFLAGLIFHNRKIRKRKLTLSIFGVISIFLVYGPIADMSFLSHVSHPTWEYFLSVLAAGVGFNVIHGVSTAVFLYTCAGAMIEKLERIKLKYGILE